MFAQSAGRTVAVAPVAVLAVAGLVVLLLAMARRHRGSGVNTLGVLALVISAALFLAFWRMSSNSSYRGPPPRADTVAEDTMSEYKTEDTMSEYKSAPSLLAGDSSADVAERDDTERPGWVDAEPVVDPVTGTYRTVVETPLEATAAERREDYRAALDEAVTDYLRRSFGEEAAAEVQVPAQFIEERIVIDRWLERVDRDVAGQSVGLAADYALLEFDEPVRLALERMWRNQVVWHRLLYAIGGVSMLLLVIGTAYGFLKLDTMTRGYYSGRLKLAAAAVILSIVYFGCLAIKLAEGRV